VEDDESVGFIGSSTFTDDEKIKGKRKKRIHIMNPSTFGAAIP
jgi:hypothetical protein